MPELIQNCPRVSGGTVRSFAVTLTCTLAVTLTIGQLHVAAQHASPTRSFIPVTVADRYHRVVTGLDKDSFVILENGSPRVVTYISNVDSPMAIAIVSESAYPSDDILKPEDDLIRASSLSDAVRQLIASRYQRQAIIVTAALDLRGVPAGIQVVQADAANLVKAIGELRRQYVLGFQRSDPAGLVEVRLNQPRNLPTLEAVWKEPF